MRLRQLGPVECVRVDVRKDLAGAGWLERK